MNQQRDPFIEELEQRLAAPVAAPQGLKTRILASLPPQDVVQRLLDWLLPKRLGHALWRPVAAAAAPLTLGFLLNLGLAAAGDGPFYGNVPTYAFAEGQFAIDSYEDFANADE